MRKHAALALAAIVGWAGAAAAADAAAGLAELRAKLAAQEARLNDLQAKLSPDAAPATPEYITSIRKNAKVTVGGAVTTSYFYNQGTLERDDGAGFARAQNTKSGSLEVSDAVVDVEIAVSENVDAFLSLNLHETTSDTGVAESAWVRWKNIANTGFGIKVGRDDLLFGDGDAAVGYLYNFTHNDGDGYAWWFEDDAGSVFLPHNSWDHSSVTQIAPYWEGLDGKLLLEASFFAHKWNGEDAYKDGQQYTTVRPDGSVRIRSRNYGLGSMSARATWTPIEDLHFSASVVNYRTNDIDGWDHAADDLAKDNTAAALSFAWRPSFLSRVNLWAQYVRGWNVNQYAGATSDALNFGLSVDVTDKLSVFAQGDYLHSTFDYTDHRDGSGSSRAVYAGGMYDMGDGLWFEAGWRYETAKRSFDAGGQRVRERIRNNLLYGSLGFEF